MKFNQTTLFQFVLILFIGCSISSCGSKTIPQKAGVTYKTAKEGTLSITSSGEAKNKQDALFNAEKNAFEVLFFKGVPGSPYSKPLIPVAENAAKSKNSNFFQEFFDNKGYKNYITQHSILSAGSRNKNTNLTEAAVALTINVASLKRALEQQNVTKKFGF